MNTRANPHEEPGLSPLEFARLQDELQKSNAELAAANAALRESEQQLEQRVTERTRELSTLLRVTHNITTVLELEPLLGLIIDQLREVVEYRLASISILESKTELLLLAVRGDGMPQPGTRFHISENSIVHHMFLKREPMFVPDLEADTALANRMRENLASQALTGLRSWMNVPLVFRDQNIGVLALAHPQANYYTASRAELTMAFANQAATAIVNARLYEQAQRLASLQERQKLARELHDSVSQALYGIVLGARTARTLLDREPTKAAEPMDYILSLAEAGLAEMRALIFELRPESLATDGLIAALNRLVNALGPRHQLKVQLVAGGEPEIPLEAKESLYRVTQEALNNIVKHANASEVDVKLRVENGQVILEISDNGIGFDTSQKFPGHLGLQSMNERVAHVGGTFTLESAPNRGTRICVMLPIARG